MRVKYFLSVSWIENFSLITILCSGIPVLSQNPKPGFPKVQFNSSSINPISQQNRNGITFLMSGGYRFSLTLECSAPYPVYWYTDYSTLKKFNTTLCLNERTSSPGIGTSRELYNFRTIIRIEIDPVSIQLLEEINYTCQSFQSSCMNNTLCIHKQFKDEPNTILVNTDAPHVQRQKYRNCPWKIESKIDKAINLKSYPALNAKQEDKKSCGDVLFLEELKANDQMTPGNTTVVLRCRSHKDYFSQGIRLEYSQLVNSTAIVPLNKTTELDSGEYHVVQANLLFHDNDYITRQAFCSAPLWNSYGWCKVAIHVTNSEPPEVTETEEPEITSKLPMTFGTSSSTTDIEEIISVRQNNESNDNTTPGYNSSVLATIENHGHLTNISNGTGQTFAGYNISSDLKTILAQNFNNGVGEEKTSFTPLLFVLVIVSAIFGLAFAIILLFLFFTVIKRKREIHKHKTYLPEFHILMSTENSLPKLPKRRDYQEISKDCVKIDEKCVLGNGTFGIVLKGILKTQTMNCGIDVAIKTTRKNCSEFSIDSLKKELKVAAKIKKHENIVQLIGAVTQDIENGSLYILLEYCSNGSLRDYLRKHKTSFKNFASSDSVELIDTRLDFEISTRDLILWSLHIASGMKFLSNQKIVHGDLACRNVLLTENRIAKLTDFGLSKQLEEYYYCFKREVPMPWKWMAYESLMYQKFSAKTDIWSFAITLWEIFSLGDSPWFGCQWGDEFLKNLEAGARPRKPEYAPEEIYSLMQQCWRSETVLRPHFNESTAQIEIILEKFTIKENARDTTFFDPSVTSHDSGYCDSGYYLIPIKSK